MEFFQNLIKHQNSIAIFHLQEKKKADEALWLQMNFNQISIIPMWNLTAIELEPK